MAENIKYITQRFDEIVNEAIIIHRGLYKVISHQYKISQQVLKQILDQNTK